jgi:hypothetical protein
MMVEDNNSTLIETTEFQNRLCFYKLTERYLNVKEQSKNAVLKKNKCALRLAAIS